MESNLPKVLVQNRAIYGILSKGIHELDEQTCLKYFPAIRDAIILILEEDSRERSRQELEGRLAADIKKISDELRGDEGRRAPPTQEA